MQMRNLRIADEFAHEGLETTRCVRAWRGAFLVEPCRKRDLWTLARGFGGAPKGWT